ncbi:MAG: FGGY family carbohydrate kinase [Bacteroidota bacterium]
MYLLGFDIGSSSIKAALVDSSSGETIAVAQYPEIEMDIISRQSGWAEQQPEVWWESICQVSRKLLKITNIDSADIKAIGIAYQMHGLVVVDKDYQVLRPSIIWCDSRAVEIGNQAFDEIGNERCLKHLLNSPGNFTASKLKWVKDNEPELYDRIHKIMLPGDYIAMKLTNEILTTETGLSEGILYDFLQNDVSDIVLDHFSFSRNLIPDVRPAFSEQGMLSKKAAEETGLKAGIPVTFRAGDQPNNAMSLNVLEPGEIAATGGTSGVVYGVVDRPAYDHLSRVNSFVHVNHTGENPRIGVLLCINGAGIQYSWIKQQIARDGTSYQDMERMVNTVPVGSDGLRIIPFGNGSERMLNNKNLGSHICNLHFNRHSRAHFYRAALEGVAFSFVYGIGILKELGLNLGAIRVGNDNLFQSQVFSTTICNLLGNQIEVIDTTGAVGAAKASGVAIGLFNSLNEAMSTARVEKVYVPTNLNGVFSHAYQVWSSDLNKLLKKD